MFNSVWELKKKNREVETHLHVLFLRREDVGLFMSTFEIFYLMLLVCYP